MHIGYNHPVNPELLKLFKEDQGERDNWKEWGKSILLEEVQKRDRGRLEAVLAMIFNNELSAGADYFHAATILQHSEKPEHYKLANELCLRAIELGEERAKWLYAATLDRYLVSSGSKFQKFGTQYRKNKNGLWELYPVEVETTDELRSKYNVPPLSKLKEREGTLNDKN